MFETAAATPNIIPDLEQYEKILVAFSGGKDSIACFLRLLDLGVPREKIELHHHLVDGREGSELFDWPCTEDYCRKFAKYFNVPIYFSWLEGGFENEIKRWGTPKARTMFETLEGTVESSGGVGKPGHRRVFPAKANDLKTRWCSSYLKIDVLSVLLRNQKRFNHSKTLVVVGERAEESKKRESYNQFEPHRTDIRGGRSGRHVDVWRAVHQQAAEDVWGTLERYRINPHPAYKMGWGRLSCRACIFGSPNQWASNKHIAPLQIGQLAELERELDFTIDHKLSIDEMVARGAVYPNVTEHLAGVAMKKEYSEPVVLPAIAWKLPAGAFGEMNGPG